MQEHAFGQNDVGTSQFNMFRCVIAMAHADHIITDEEQAYVMGFVQKLPFTEEQKSTLLADLKEKQDMRALLSHINDPKYRGQLVYFARLLAYKDGNLHPEEDELLQYFKAAITENIDMEGIRASVNEEVQRELILQEIKTDSGRPDTGFSGLFDRFMLFCGIDLMDE